MSDKKWYVLRTAGGKEKKAMEYLQKEIERNGLSDQVDQVIVPTKKEVTTKNGKRKTVEKLLYPSYVLIQADLSPELEYIIRNLVPGMSGFLTESKEVSTTRKLKRTLEDGTTVEVPTKTTLEKVPIPLRDDEARRLLGIQDESAGTTAPTEVNFEIGEPVKITDGAFNGFSGTVEEIIEDRSKLKVMVVIFGRKTLLELGFTQVTKE